MCSPFAQVTLKVRRTFRHRLQCWTSTAVTAVGPSLVSVLGATSIASQRPVLLHQRKRCSLRCNAGSFRQHSRLRKIPSSPSRSSTTVSASLSALHRDKSPQFAAQPCEISGLAYLLSSSSLRVFSPMHSRCQSERFASCPRPCNGNRLPQTQTQRPRPSGLSSCSKTVPPLFLSCFPSPLCTRLSPFCPFLSAIRLATSSPQRASLPQFVTRSPQSWSSLPIFRSVQKWVWPTSL